MWKDISGIWAYISTDANGHVLLKVSVDHIKVYCNKHIFSQEKFPNLKMTALLLTVQLDHVMIDWMNQQNDWQGDLFTYLISWLKKWLTDELVAQFWVAHALITSFMCSLSM